MAQIRVPYRKGAPLLDEHAEKEGFAAPFSHVFPADLCDVPLCFQVFEQYSGYNGANHPTVPANGLEEV